MAQMSVENVVKEPGNSQSIEQPQKHGIENDSVEHDVSKSDEEMKDAPPSNKKQKNRPHHVLHQHTLRKLHWTYFHLQLLTLSPTVLKQYDLLSAKRDLNTILQTHLGIYGSSIHVDILKFEKGSDSVEMWIRVPRVNAVAVHESVSGWVSAEWREEERRRWVVKGRDEVLVRLVGRGRGEGLFRP